MNKQDLEIKIIALMKTSAYKPLTEEELISQLAIEGDEINIFWSIMQDMQKAGTIVCTRFNTYGLPEKMNLTVGVLSLTSKGFGFLIPDDKEQEDIFIAPSMMLGAMNGDRVMARINCRPIGKQPEGEIRKILTRATAKIVGNFHQRKNFGFVIPDNKKVAQDIFVSRKNFAGAKDGQKVVVELTIWPKDGKSAEGNIIEVLGMPGEDGLDIISIIKQHNLELDFPKEVVEAAKKVKQVVEPDDIGKRRDSRDKLIVTIDSDSAKDLDDAVCVEKLSDNQWLLGVYIADVSHYVTENSIIDKEARERATSVYLLDRVLPMLPEGLSNGICSLNPSQDRLVMACEMQINNSGTVEKYEIFPSVINTNQRLSYTGVRAIIEDGTVPANISKELHEMLLTMAQLSGVLKQKRLNRGAVDFDFPEQKVVLDATGKPVEIIQTVRTIAESLIEEFMLAANETVAEHLSKLHIPAMYRVHEDPDEEKIQTLSTLLETFGLKLTTDKKVKPLDLQNILKKIQGKGEEKLIAKVILRSLKQADYKAENLGHFGLAAKYYTHFTSPIRRYPDLVVHRLLKEVAKGKVSEERCEALQSTLPNIAEHSSKRERIAEQAERDIIDLKKAEYMVDFVGQEFDGTISGVTSFGLFVELANGIEGLLHMSSLTDDYYIYEEDKYRLIGENTQTIYRVGDPIKIEVLQVNVEDRAIDFILPGQKVATREMILQKMKSRKPTVQEKITAKKQDKKSIKRKPINKKKIKIKAKKNNKAK